MGPFKDKFSLIGDEGMIGSETFGQMRENLHKIITDHNLDTGGRFAPGMVRTKESGSSKESDKQKQLREKDGNVIAKIAGLAGDAWRTLPPGKINKAISGGINFGKSFIKQTDTKEEREAILKALQGK
jgi:hypothetical protein